MEKDRVILEIKTSRVSEETTEAMVQFLASLTGLRRRFMLLWRLGHPISLELAVFNQTIHFYVTCPTTLKTFIEGQLTAAYPKSLIVNSRDYMPEIITKKPTLAMGQMKLNAGYLYPLKTYHEFKEVDPLASLLAVLSKAQPNDKIVIQYLLNPIGSGWHKSGERQMNSKIKDGAGVEHSNPHAKVIAQKISFHGFKTAIRVAVNSDSYERSRSLLYEIANSYSAFNNPGGNSLGFKKLYLWQKDRFIKALNRRSKRFAPSVQILNIEELATLFHFPTEKLSKIHSISWHKVVLSEPPENLPIAEGLSDEEKADINFFASTEFKNRQTIFGIKNKDRRRHVYIIGKTGAGKSTLIANMAINDMRNRKGFCIIDPHGDLCQVLLDYIPSYRVNDIIYLDPSDRERAFAINPLEVNEAHQKELVVSGIVAIFNKLYGHSWGPRLEYILRNTLQSVIEMPDATLMMVPEMLANDSFRARVVSQLQDPVLRSFWENEFANYTDKLKAESIMPIQNKVGQFVGSTVIRNIIKNPKSTIDLQKVMDEGKIVLVNLSQGQLGEDNAALLGAMLITKIQLAAMNRVTQREEDRRDFYLYVDEFQNFATSSFVKILSEARKYRLNLILANQYIAQVPEDVRSAIFGNAGTMMSFLIGAEDAPYMAKEFSERFEDKDLLSLGNYQTIIKLAIDNISQSPFLAQTLPLPRSVTQNREKAIRSSKERYTRPI
jgi:energy-coupling factor transporter ATP-binding protein EcfA2